MLRVVGQRVQNAILVGHNTTLHTHLFLLFIEKNILHFAVAWSREILT